MSRTLSTVLLIASLSTCAMTSAIAKEQTFNDDEQRVVLALCDLGEWANRVQMTAPCAYLRQKIGQLPPPAAPGASPVPEPAPKPE